MKLEYVWEHSKLEKPTDQYVLNCDVPDDEIEINFMKISIRVMLEKNQDLSKYTTVQICNYMAVLKWTMHYYKNEVECKIYKKILFEYVIYCLTRKDLTKNEVERLSNISLKRTVSRFDIPEEYHNFIKDVFTSRKVVNVMMGLVKEISPSDMIKKDKMKDLLDRIVEKHILSNLFAANLHPEVQAITTFFRTIVISESFLKEVDISPSIENTPNNSPREEYKQIEKELVFINNYYSDSEFEQLLVKNITGKGCGTKENNIAALLITLLHECGHLVLRLLNPSLTDIFNSTLKLSGKRIKEAGILLEEKLLGTKIDYINVNVAEYLLKIESWKDNIKKFKKTIKTNREKDGKLDISTGKAMRIGTFGKIIGTNWCGNSRRIEKDN
jgi:hypothetical protein